MTGVPWPNSPYQSLMPLIGASPVLPPSGKVGVAGRVSHCGSARAAAAVRAKKQSPRTTAMRRMTASPNLSRPVRPVAGVTEARDDESIIIERLVDCRGPDRHVGMHAAHVLDAGRGADQRHQPDVLGAALLQTVHRGH